MKPALAATCAALVLLTAACGSRVKDWPDGALEPSDYYANGATTRTTRQLSTDDTVVTTDTTTKKAKGSSPTPATVKPGELPAPAPGAYTYDETTTTPGFEGEAPDNEKQATTESWAVQRSGDSATLTSTVKEDDGEFSSTTTSTFRVTAGKLELLSQRAEYADDDPETCTYKPPALVLKLPLSAGQKWKTSSRCDDGSESGQELEFEVMGTANDTVGGEKVATYLVRSTYSFDTTDDTTGEKTKVSFTDTRHVDPTTLLTVIEDVNFTFDKDTTTVHRQLRSLKPA